jgi:benzil reductase ((S)-benzoin forming)
MKRDYYIVTGTSRGIGEALAKQLLGPDTVLVCISRNQNPGMGVEAYIKKWELKDIALDLTQHDRIAETVRGVFREIDPDDIASITLINNAGIIHPIRRVGDTDAAAKISRSVGVNLTAAMIMTDAFIHETVDLAVPRKVVFLTTGAARRIVKGWSAYSAGKAGLEMYVKVLAEEQEDVANPVQLMAFSPGVVDTEMQAEIRNATAEEFPELEKFKAYKEKGQLLNADEVAKALIELIKSPDFGKELLVSIKDKR